MNEQEGTTPDIPTADNNRSTAWPVACHLTALSAFIGIPFGNFLGPLIVWLLKKNDMPDVDEHGKKSLNFQLSIFVYSLAVTLFGAVLAGITYLLLPPEALVIPLGLLIIAVILLTIADIVLVIMAGIKTSKGENYNYPYSMQFIK